MTAELTSLCPLDIRFSERLLDPCFPQPSVLQLRQLEEPVRALQWQGEEQDAEQEEESGQEAWTSWAWAAHEALVVEQYAGLQAVADALVAGSLKPEELLPMRCVHDNGAWVALDNRRLWLLRQWAAARRAAGEAASVWVAALPLPSQEQGQEPGAAQAQVSTVLQEQDPVLAELRAKLASAGLQAPCTAAELQTWPPEAMADFRRTVLAWDADCLLLQPSQLRHPGAAGSPLYSAVAAFNALQDEVRRGGGDGSAGPAWGREHEAALLCGPSCGPASSARSSGCVGPCALPCIPSPTSPTPTHHLPPVPYISLQVRARLAARMAACADLHWSKATLSDPLLPGLLRPISPPKPAEHTPHALVRVLLTNYQAYRGVHTLDGVRPGDLLVLSNWTVRSAAQWAGDGVPTYLFVHCLALVEAVEWVPLAPAAAAAGGGMDGQEGAQEEDGDEGLPGTREGGVTRALVCVWAPPGTNLRDRLGMSVRLPGQYLHVARLLGGSHWLAHWGAAQARVRVAAGCGGAVAAGAGPAWGWGLGLGQLGPEVQAGWQEQQEGGGAASFPGSPLGMPRAASGSSSSSSSSMQVAQPVEQHQVQQQPAQQKPAQVQAQQPKGPWALRAAVEAQVCSLGLNPSQAAAVKQVALVAQQLRVAAGTGAGAVSFRPQLVQAPPATGQTRTVAAMLSTLCDSGAAVLLTGSSDQAVSKVAARLLQHIRARSAGVAGGAGEGQGTSNGAAGASGKSSRSSSSDGSSAQQPLLPGDLVLLVSSRAEAGLSAPLKALLPQAKAGRVVSALGQRTGLAYWAASASQLLCNAHAQFGQWSELAQRGEAWGALAQQVEAEVGRRPGPQYMFRGWLLPRLQEQCGKAVAAAAALLDSLPSNLLPPGTAQGLVQLQQALSQLQACAAAARGAGLWACFKEVSEAGEAGAAAGGSEVVPGCLQLQDILQTAGAALASVPALLASLPAILASTVRAVATHSTTGKPLQHLLVAHARAVCCSLATLPTVQQARVSSEGAGTGALAPPVLSTCVALEACQLYEAEGNLVFQVGGAVNTPGAWLHVPCSPLLLLGA